MKQSLFKRVGISIAKSIAMFITFGVLALVSRLIFKGNLFDEEMLSPRAVAGWNFAFLLFIFESTVFAFHRHAGESRRLFFETCAGYPRHGKLKSVFLTPDLYVEFACVAILSLLLPLSFAYDCVGLVFFGELYGKGQVLLVILPILLVLEVFAHLSVRSAWITDRVETKGKKEKKDVTLSIQSIVITAMAYCAASLVIPWILPFIVTIANLGAGAITFLYIAGAVLIAILSVIAAFYVRAIKKRRDFVHKLTTYCREHAVPLSEIRKPYASLFFEQDGVDFTIELNHTVYDCKLMACIFPGSPMVFSDTGMGIRQDTLRLFKVNILHLNTLLDYRMDNRPAENRKILIILPVPKDIYASVGGSVPRPADTGEPVGAYTLYHASGFLNALERDILN